jgi:hypothetical protein
MPTRKCHPGWTIWFVAMVTLAVLMALAPHAHGQASLPTVDSGDAPGFIIRLLGSPSWKVVLIGAVLGLTWGTRTWGASVAVWASTSTAWLAHVIYRTHLGLLLAWTATDAGGATTALVWSIAGTVATGLVIGRTDVGPLIRNAIITALAAAGGWTRLKRLVRRK